METGSLLLTSEPQEVKPPQNNFTGYLGRADAHTGWVGGQAHRGHACSVYCLRPAAGRCPAGHVSLRLSDKWVMRSDPGAGAPGRPHTHPARCGEDGNQTRVGSCSQTERATEVQTEEGPWEVGPTVPRVHQHPEAQRSVSRSERSAEVRGRPEWGPASVLTPKPPRCIPDTALRENRPQEHAEEDRRTPCGPSRGEAFLSWTKATKEMGKSDYTGLFKCLGCENKTHQVSWANTFAVNRTEWSSGQS